MNILTWNMQGATSSGESKWNTDVRRWFLAGRDVVLLQECGATPGSSQQVVAPGFLPGRAVPGGVAWTLNSYNMGTTSRPNVIYLFWIHSDPGGNRCNLGIAARVMPTSLIYIANPVVGGRPAIGARFAYGVGHVDIYTLHAFSGGGGDAPGLLNGIYGTSATWFVGGDFNRFPNTWAPAPAMGGLPLAPGVTGVPAGISLCPHGNVATHPGTGTNLDYAFKTGASVNGTVEQTYVASDHYGVTYVV